MCRFLVPGLLLLTLLGCFWRKATPQTTTLTYQGPQTYTLRPGDWLPGTDVRYVGRSADGAEFLIGGQKALKQKADSLNWSGSPAAGVWLDLRLRIIWFTDEALYTAGTVKVAVSDPAPAAGEISTRAPLSYQVPATYGLPVGQTAPGTTLAYEGRSAEGGKFTGVEGYPFRQPGDSLRWEGWLRPNVALRLDLRVAQYDDRAARLAGLAHLWISP
mgnify:CR=1 FL=1